MKQIDFKDLESGKYYLRYHESAGILHRKMVEVFMYERDCLLSGLIHGNVRVRLRCTLSPEELILHTTEIPVERLGSMTLLAETYGGLFFALDETEKYAILMSQI